MLSRNPGPLPSCYIEDSEINVEKLLGELSRNLTYICIYLSIFIFSGCNKYIEIV